MNTKIMNQQKLYKSCEQFVLGVYKTFDSQPQKLKTFINLFNRNGRANNQLLESQMHLVELIQDFPDLVEQLNVLVPEDFRVPLLEAQGGVVEDENIDIDIQSAIKELQARHPEKVENLIKIIQDIQDIKDNKSLPNIDGPKEKLRLLLQEDEPNLYNMFIKYLKNVFDETTLNKEEEMEPINESSNPPLSVRMETEDRDEFRPRGMGVGRGGFEKRLRGGKRPLLRDRNMVQPATSTVEKIDATTLPATIRNELYLFEYLRSNLSSDEYDELVKILYLYTEYIISANEVYMMSKHLFYENENYFSFFCDIISAREAARKKNCSSSVKPLSEIDFKKMGCERIRSYTKVPASLPHMKRPPHPTNPIAFKVLNKTWISVSQGSEVNFKINAKNAYEESLLKCEEERYEFDTVIYNCTTAIKWLNDLENQIGEDKLNYMVERILRLKVIQKVYGNNVEIVDIFRKSPLNVAKVLAERIQTKLKEIKETKFNQARKKWHETSQENFHRSLDHRSLYFKQYEKKLTYHKNFNTDALSRFNELNITGSTKNLQKYWSILNTFDAISNGVSCKHEKPDNTMLFNLINKNPFPRRNLPIFRMTFANKTISQDIFDMLSLRVQNFHANLTEKDKISKCLKAFMLELLKFPYELGRSRDLVFEPKTLLEIASRIESKIYVESFNFNASKPTETNNDAGKETIYTVIERLRQGAKDGDRRKDIDGDGFNRDSNSNSNQGFFRKMDEELAPKKNPTESFDDELRFDSGSEDQNNIREMEYISKDDGKINSEFVPQQEKGQIMFYGTQHIYYLVRFYFTLYERFLKAYEISQEFEMNSKTAVLSPEEKGRLAQERYEVFKWILVHLIRSNIDNTKYEDLLRSVFGNRAYLMYYIDKIIHLIIITIQKMINDDISIKTLNLYPETDLFGKGFEAAQRSNTNKPKNWVENVYIAQLNNLTLKNIACLPTTNFFRFLYDPQTSSMVVNLYNSPYKNWNDKILESISNTQQQFLNTSIDETCLRGSLNNIYLKRAKERNRKKTVRVLIKIVQDNNIEWKYIPDTIRLVTDSFHQEDFLWIVKRKAPASKEMIKKVSSKLKSLNRFREWHKNALQNMNAKLP